MAKVTSPTCSAGPCVAFILCTELSLMSIWILYVKQWQNMHLMVMGMEVGKYARWTLVLQAGCETRGCIFARRFLYIWKTSSSCTLNLQQSFSPRELSCKCSHRKGKTEACPPTFFIFSWYLFPCFLLDLCILPKLGCPLAKVGTSLNPGVGRVCPTCNEQCPSCISNTTGQKLTLPLRCVLKSRQTCFLFFHLKIMNIWK